jgi:hypothetical protein
MFDPHLQKKTPPLRAASLAGNESYDLASAAVVPSTTAVVATTASAVRGGSMTAATAEAA